ncbi:2-phospho-L-lactate guanylyltransferase [uncultured Methanomethylovorans sp.]|uniref:2-phospho-L-lactate guanylyltransferase n=1 Tax=uncultured Methanomethylovorans sp. TaxID=183759 RepID=UPI002AA6E7E3|nr:2-phospho-L-lactate guanylyltransferase [uncultured Methanomethylovorans sp.]
MRAVIPYKKENAKSRLSPILSRIEREQFVELMLRDVVSSLREAGVNDIDILATSEYRSLTDLNVNIIIDPNDLNESINKYLEKMDQPVLIIMADLPLARSEQVKNIINSNEDVVIVPGKGGGTNVLSIKNPSRFHVQYYGMSFCNHCAIAKDMQQSLRIYDSFLLSTDIDEPHDIVEILLHGHGFSLEYAQGKFELESGRARVKLTSTQ